MCYGSDFNFLLDEAGRDANDYEERQQQWMEEQFPVDSLSAEYGVCCDCGELVLRNLLNCQNHWLFEGCCAKTKLAEQALKDSLRTPAQKLRDRFDAENRGVTKRTRRTRSRPYLIRCGH